MASRASPLPDDFEKRLFDAVLCSVVVEHHCLITREHDDEIEIVYVGPMKKAPDIRGTRVYMSEPDFNRLSESLKKSRH